MHIQENTTLSSFLQCHGSHIHPADPHSACPAPSHPLLGAIMANFPVANALVLSIYTAALRINVLLPWHQILVGPGSLRLAGL